MAEDPTPSADEYLAAFHGLPAGGVILERRGPGLFHILDVNRAAQQNAAWRTVDREHVIGRDIADVFPGVREGLLDTYEQALRTGEPLDLGDFEYGDEQVPEGVFRIQLVPLRPDLLLIFFENVSERVQTDRRLRARTLELEASTAQLDAANRELEAFSVSLAHDLKNPLLTVIQFADLLQRALTDRPVGEESDYLKRIQTAGRTMTRILDDLRALSEVTRAPLRREAVDLASLARDVFRDLSASRPERVVRFDVADLRAEGDRALLRVLLVHLLDNAWKFTSTREEATIELGMEPDGAVPTFFVRDNGIGFEPKYSDRIFRAFERLHTDAALSGSGLGLTCVARIAGRHGGRAWAEAETGRGATVRFTLEARPAEEVDPWNLG